MLHKERKREGRTTGGAAAIGSGTFKGCGCLPGYQMQRERKEKQFSRVPSYDFLLVFLPGKIIQKAI